MDGKMDTSKTITSRWNLLEWVIDDEGCITPDRGVGNCISIKECKPIIDFLQNTPKPLPQNIKNKLNLFVCGYERKSIKVCCPSKSVDMGNGNIIKISDNYLHPPPDVRGHKNYNLLPRNCGYLPVADKIANGRNASLNEFPWMALLSYKTARGPQFRCGGSIINNKWILTAAHCVTGLTEPLLGVRTGEHNIVTRIDCEIQNDGRSNKCTSPVQDLAIEDVRVHPEFNLTIISNDIALIKVSRINLNRENVKPICLPTNDHTREVKLKNVIVTGWGITETGQMSDILQKVSLPIVSLEQCKAAYKNDARARITYKQICAGGKARRDSCPGDSGGPLQVAGYIYGETRYVQQGIISFGPRECGLEGFPGVYTKIAYYMDWILDTIGN